MVAGERDWLVGLLNQTRNRESCLDADADDREGMYRSTHLLHMLASSVRSLVDVSSRSIGWLPLPLPLPPQKLIIYGLAAFGMIMKQRLSPSSSAGGQHCGLTDCSRLAGA